MCWKGVFVRRRRAGERLALWVLILTLVHTGLTLRAMQGPSQDYINGSVAAELGDIKRRLAGMEETQGRLLWTVIGGIVAQGLQLLFGAARRQQEKP